MKLVFRRPALSTQLVKAFTVADFPELISRRSMLPLIVFSVGVGVATRSCTGDNVAAMLVTRLTSGKGWLTQAEGAET